MANQTPQEKIAALQRGASIAQANEAARRAGRTTFFYNNQTYATSARGAVAGQQQPKLEDEARNIPVHDISTQSSRMLTQREYDLAIKTGKTDQSGIPYVATKHYGLNIGRENIEQVPGQPPRLVSWKEGQLPVSTAEGVKTIQRQEPMSQGRSWQWGDTLPLTPYQHWVQGMNERTVGIFPKDSPAQSFLRGGSEWERAKQGLFQRFGGKETYVASSAVDWSAGFTVGTLAFANTIGELSLASMWMRGGRPEYVGQYIKEGFIEPIYQDITKIGWSGDAQSRIAQLALITVAPFAAGKFAANAALIAKGRPMWEDVYVKHGKAPSFDMTIKGPIVKTSKGTLVTVESVMSGSYKATGAKTGQPIGKGEWQSTSRALTLLPSPPEAVNLVGITTPGRWEPIEQLVMELDYAKSMDRLEPMLGRSVTNKIGYVTKSSEGAYNAWGDTVIPELFWREPVITSRSYVESRLAAVRDIMTVTDQTFTTAEGKGSRVVEGSSGEGYTYEKIKVYGDKTIDMFRAESMTGYATHAAGPVFEYGSGKPIVLGERPAMRGGQSGTEFSAVVMDAKSGPDYTGEIFGTFFATKEQLNALKGVFESPKDPINRILRSGKHTPFSFTDKPVTATGARMPSATSLTTDTVGGTKAEQSAGTTTAPADVSGSRAVMSVMPALEDVVTMAPSKAAIPRGELKSLPQLFSVPESAHNMMTFQQIGMGQITLTSSTAATATQTSSRSAQSQQYKQISSTKSGQMMDVSSMVIQGQKYIQSPKQATATKTVQIQTTETLLTMLPPAVDIVTAPRPSIKMFSSFKPLWLPGLGGGQRGGKKKKRELVSLTPSKLDYSASLGGLASGKSIKRKPSTAKIFMPTEIRLPVMRGIGL